MENGKTLGTIVIEEPATRDATRKPDAKPGMVANGEIAHSPKKVEARKNALTFDPL